VGLKSVEKVTAAHKMDRAIKYGLIFLIIYCPLAFGAVHIFSFTLMEITVLGLWLCWLMKQLFSNPGRKGDFAPGEGTEGRGAVKRRVRRIELSFRKSPLNYFALAFIGLIILQVLPWPASWVKAVSPGTFRMYQAAWGKVPDFMTLSICNFSSKIGLFKILAYIGAFLLIINWADSREKIMALVLPFVLIGSIEAIYGLLTYLGKYRYIWWFQNIWYGGSVNGTYFNRNHLAGLLEMAIPMSFGLLVAMGSKSREHNQGGGKLGGIRGFLLSLNIDDHDQARKILLIFLIAIMTLAIFLSGSRGGILSLAAAFMVMSTLLMSRSKTRRYAIAGLVIMLIALGYGLYTGLDATLKRFENSKMSDDAQTRIRFAETSLGIVRDYPLLGTGWGTFEDAYRKYQDPKDDGLTIDHAHHDWVQLAAETGLVGFGVGIFFLVFCLGYFFFLWMKRKNSLSIGIGLGGMGAIISLALHSLTDFNMHIPANALLLSMVVGITLRALTYHRHRRGEDRAAEEQLRKKQQKQEKVTMYFPAWFRWPLALFLVTGFCYAVMLVRAPYLAEKVAPTLPDSTIRKIKDPTLEVVCKAISHEPTNAEYFYWLASILEEGGGDQQRKYDQPQVRAVLEKLHADARGNESNAWGNERNERNEGNVSIEENASTEGNREKQEENHDGTDGKDGEEGEEGEDREDRKEGKAGNDLALLALKRAIMLNPANPYYHLKLAWHTLDQGKLDENMDHFRSILAAAEDEFGRAVYFMPQSANINFSVGYYWIWKSKVVEDEKVYLFAFDRFIQYFQTTYRINNGYKKKIEQVVQQYYPIMDILTRIFSL